MNKKFKSIANIVLDVVIVLFLVFAAMTLVVSLSQKAEATGGNVSHIFGYTFRSVQTESMEAYNEDGSKADGAFFKGDIIICKIPDEDTTFNVGDAVMFWMPITRNSDGSFSECIPSLASDQILVTHSIVEIVNENGMTLYRTKGLNDKSVEDINLKQEMEFKAVYTGKRIGGVGSFIDFVKSGLGFFLCIILPIAIFAIIQVVRVIRNFIAYKSQKAAVAVASGELTEEQKKLIAEEYLKQQKAAEDDTASSTVEDTADGE